MWYEAKIVIGGIGVILIAIVISQIIFLNLFLSVILFFAIGLWVFADIVFGYVYHNGDAKKLVDKPPGNKTLGVVFNLNNMFSLEWAEKGPYGVRRWVANNKEASCIDLGDYPIHTKHGVLGFVAHEKSEKNVNLYNVEMAEQLNKEFKTDNIKEMYYQAIKQETKELKEGTN